MDINNNMRKTLLSHPHPQYFGTDWDIIVDGVIMGAIRATFEGELKVLGFGKEGCLAEKLSIPLSELIADLKTEDESGKEKNDG